MSQVESRQANWLTSISIRLVEIAEPVDRTKKPLVFSKIGRRAILHYSPEAIMNLYQGSLRALDFIFLANEDQPYHSRDQYNHCTSN